MTVSWLTKKATPPTVEPVADKKSPYGSEFLQGEECASRDYSLLDLVLYGAECRGFKHPSCDVMATERTIGRLAKAVGVNIWTVRTASG